MRRPRHGLRVGRHLAEVRDRLGAFEDRYNVTAQPFRWRFTTSDLVDLPAGLDRRALDQQEESARLRA
ncbi:hypothetical protein [Streptomyces hokutonensis]|uniref:hypothetical protein n=1 Tax=Streptomyces hokutonensis TaxID=1306990 RepID=UPI0036CFE942